MSKEWRELIILEAGSRKQEVGSTKHEAGSWKTEDRR
jgi:hypothetical protein